MVLAAVGIAGVLIATMIVVPICILGVVISWLVYCDSQNLEVSLPNRDKRHLRHRQHKLKMLQCDIAEDELIHERMKTQQKQLS